MEVQVSPVLMPLKIRTGTRVLPPFKKGRTIKVQGSPVLIPLQKKGWERETERDRDRDRQTDRQTERNRETCHSL
jgi:hypothetical protein